MNHPVDDRILELEAFVYMFQQWHVKYPEWLPQDLELEALAISAERLLNALKRL